MCYHSYVDFKTACCKSRNSVSAIFDAPTDARNDFNLNTEDELIDFICNDGLNDLEFINTTPFRLNPAMMVDAYSFRTLGKFGYLAFMYSNVTHKWLIKSFRINKTTNPALKYAFEKVGIIKG